MNRHLLKEFEKSVTDHRAKGVTEEQLLPTKLAFFAGANAFYKCVMTLFTDDREPTEYDLNIMRDLDAELKEHMLKYNVRLTK